MLCLIYKVFKNLKVIKKYLLKEQFMEKVRTLKRECDINEILSHTC